MKNPSFRAAVALPAVLLLVFGASALGAVSAFAESGDPAAAVTRSPTAAASSGPTAPSAASAPTAPASASARTARSSAAAPATRRPELTVTSPLTDEDGLVQSPDTRTVVVEGRAPVGAVVSVGEAFSRRDTPYASMTTTARTFSLTVTFPADGPYDTLAVVNASVGTTDLVPTYLEFVFDAEPSAAPALGAPADGSGFTVKPLPFGYSAYSSILQVSGTGTPGDDILLMFADAGTAPSYDEYGQLDSQPLGGQLNDITVGDDGTWRADAAVLYGTVSISAAQVEYWPGDFYEPVTHASDLSNAHTITVVPPAGTVVAPDITRPSSFDDVTFGDPGSDGSLARLLAAPTLTAHADAVRAKRRSHPAADPTGAAARVKRVQTESPVGLDDLVRDDGIQLRGAPVAGRPGYVSTTVSGTGTPGDHIVLLQGRPESAFARLATIYPAFFASIEAGEIPTRAGTVSRRLPTDHGRITVNRNGEWSTRVTLKAGPYLLTAFATEPSASKTPRYSVAGPLVAYDLSGGRAAAATPAGATPAGQVAGAEADPAELAMTGTGTPVVPALAAGAGLVALGVALMVGVRRRRAQFLRLRPATRATPAWPRRASAPGSTRRAWRG